VTGPASTATPTTPTTEPEVQIVFEDVLVPVSVANTIPSGTVPSGTVPGSTAPTSAPVTSAVEDRRGPGAGTDVDDHDDDAGEDLDGDDRRGRDHGEDDADDDAGDEDRRGPGHGDDDGDDDGRHGHDGGGDGRSDG
jgi:hypothetical protein